MKKQKSPQDFSKLTDQQLRELAIQKLKGRELFPESNKIAKEMLKKIKIFPKGL